MSQETVVGIDLGTTFSVISYVDQSGRPCTIPNAEGDLTTPSVIYYDGNEVVVGKEAIKAASVEPENIGQFAKRDMGSDFFSKTIHGEKLPPEVVQSFVLQKLKADAELKIGPISKAVITVPAFFNEPRRKATQDAGALAGLDVIDIINEPTAAAIAYGVQEGFLDQEAQSQREETVMVYDLGGGTFDVTLMRIAGTDYQALATSGDVYLGGIDWDRRIVDFIAEKFLEAHPGSDPRQNSSGLQRLLREAEDTKRTLSTRSQTTITFEFKGEAARVPLDREMFDELTLDLLERTRFTVKHVLQGAKLSWKDVTRVLLVGGSTRMPQVYEMLNQEWGHEVDRSLAADEAVAHGAAIYAELLMDHRLGRKARASVSNVNSHDLGVLGIEQATGRPRSRVMIPRNSALPARRVARFATHHADQRSVKVNVIEGGDESGNNSTPIGKCVVRDLPPGLPAGTPVDVIFSYAPNGRLSVEARLESLKKKAILDIERVGGMSDDQLDQWKRKLNSNGPLKFTQSPQ